MATAGEIYTLGDLERWSEVTAGVQPPIRLAVCGDPVAHSASPPMHNGALAACGIDAQYTRLHLRADELERAFPLLAPLGFVGVNCTIPHKLTALELVDRMDDSARRAGGVNTVQVDANGRLVGHSTDGPGLSRAVCEAFGVSLGEMRILVLGAGGGAGRAVAMQCAFEGCTRLTLLNRTLEKIEPLAKEIERAFPACRVSIDSFAESALAVQMAQSDLVVNCTSLGMKRDDLSPLPSEFIEARHCVYDTIYTAARTPLMLASDRVGARSANGLTMLLHQGAIAFEIWFQRDAPVEIMRSALLAVAPR